MYAAGYVTIVAAVLIIAVVALGLIQVILHLTAVTKALATLQVGVDAIADSTAPVGPTIASVNANLVPVREWCEAV
jgi:hypothetical protein